MTRKSENKHALSGILRSSAAFSFVIAAALLVILIVLQIDAVKEKYVEYLYILEEFEMRVAALRSRWLILVVIFLLFLLRSMSMMYPYPMIFIITAMVFPPIQSFLINILGIAFTFAFRYYTGYEMGEGTLNFALKKHPAIMRAMEEGGRGNPLILITLRTVPSLPLNTISNFYGSIEYPFGKFMLLSVGAYIPKLISYSFIGNYVYDPFSPKFFVPIIVLCVFTGICLLVLNSFFNLRNKIKVKNK